MSEAVLVVSTSNEVAGDVTGYSDEGEIAVTWAGGPLEYVKDDDKVDETVCSAESSVMKLEGSTRDVGIAAVSVGVKVKNVVVVELVTRGKQ